MPSSGRASAYSRNRIRYRYRSASRPSSLARSPGSAMSPGARPCDWVREPPGAVGVERGVGVGGPSAVHRDHVLPLVHDRHAERLTRSPDVHDTARSGETEGVEHIVVLLLDGLVVGAALVLGDRVA